jgi:hypothetical protein
MKKIFGFLVALTLLAGLAFGGYRLVQGLNGCASSVTSAVSSIHDKRLAGVKLTVASDDLSAFDSGTNGIFYLIDSVSLKNQFVVAADVLAEISPETLVRVRSCAAGAPKDGEKH